MTTPIFILTLIIQILGKSNMLQAICNNTDITTHILPYLIVLVCILAVIALLIQTIVCMILFHIDTEKKLNEIQSSFNVK